MPAVHAYYYPLGARLRVTGEDASDFLQSQFSQDLRNFETGQCTYGLWLDVKGKVIADSWVLCEDAERFWIVSEHCPANILQEKLDKHIIADDVCIDVCPSAPACSLIGAGATTLLEISPKPDTFVRGQDCIIFCGRRSLEPSYEIVFEDLNALNNFEEHLQTCGGVLPAKDPWIQQQRIAAAIPLVPQEIGASDLPGEGGFIDDAVSLTKGCYLGQEVVARMHNLGKARRALYRVQGSGKAPDCPQVLRTEAGKVAGELRTAFNLANAWQGVALMKLLHLQTSTPISTELGAVEIISPLRDTSDASK